jgi:methyltransferase-like protein
MLCLAEAWPRALAFPTLLAQARARLGADSEEGLQVDAQVLAGNLLQAYGYSASLADLHARAPQPVLEASDRPVASPVARYQAREGIQVTNLWHERVTLDGVERFLLLHLDGSRDRGALVELLERGPLADGTLTLPGGEERDAEETRGAAEVRRMLAEGVEQRLHWLARAALLVS